MARKPGIEIDLDPVDEGVLTIIPIEGHSPPPTMIEVTEVPGISPFLDSESVHRYDVEVEFIPEDMGLEVASFAMYLNSFRFASVSQEAMTNKIRNDLCETLDIDDVFVQVHQTSPASKRTSLGSPK